MTHAVVVACMLLLSCLPFCDGNGYSSHGARAAFERAFDSCKAYPFVQKHIDTLERAPGPDDTYAIYSFAEHGLGSNGGLGDRLAGLVTMAAFAARTGRRLLIVADAPFKASFVPYHPNNLLHTGDPGGSSQFQARFHWHDWKWSGWQDSMASNMSHAHGCVNPKGHSFACALDSGTQLGAFKVVKHRGNRCYLCRWAVREGQGLRAELLQTLGVGPGTDLYHVAGCLLRLAMWPSDSLWARLDDWVAKQDPSLAAKLALRPQQRHEARLVSVHFRCGDSSFSAKGEGDTAANPQCVVDPTGKSPWTGTDFGDDYSMDSPLEMAACATQLLAEQAGGGGGVLLYVASDYAPSARQINSTAAAAVSLVPQGACHVDHASKEGAHACAINTYVEWLLLGLSDALVVQSLKKKEGAQYAFYNEYSEGTKQRMAQLEAAEPGGPVSAFSRYAAMFGLRGGGALRFGKGCVAANRTALSWQTRSNWMCDNKNFY